MFLGLTKWCTFTWANYGSQCKVALLLPLPRNECFDIAQIIYAYGKKLHVETCGKLGDPLFCFRQPIVQIILIFSMVRGISLKKKCVGRNRDAVLLLKCIYCGVMLVRRACGSVISAKPGLVSSVCCLFGMRDPS